MESWAPTYFTGFLGSMLLLAPPLSCYVEITLHSIWLWLQKMQQANLGLISTSVHGHMGTVISVLDLLVWWLEKNHINIPQMVVETIGGVGSGYLPPKCP